MHQINITDAAQLSRDALIELATLRTQILRGFPSELVQQQVELVISLGVPSAQAKAYAQDVRRTRISGRILVDVACRSLEEKVWGFLSGAVSAIELRRAISFNPV